MARAASVLVCALILKRVLLWKPLETTHACCCWVTPWPQCNPCAAVAGAPPSLHTCSRTLEQRGRFVLLGSGSISNHRHNPRHPRRHHHQVQNGESDHQRDATDDRHRHQEIPDDFLEPGRQTSQPRVVPAPCKHGASENTPGHRSRCGAGGLCSHSPRAVAQCPPLSCWRARRRLRPGQATACIQPRTRGGLQTKGCSPADRSSQRGHCPTPPPLGSAQAQTQRPCWLNAAEPARPPALVAAPLASLDRGCAPPGTAALTPPGTRLERRRCTGAPDARRRLRDGRAADSERGSGTAPRGGGTVSASHDGQTDRQPFGTGPPTASQRTHGSQC